MTHNSMDVNGVETATLECLNTWPVGSCGESSERMLLITLNEMCKKFGYGALPQLAAQIEAPGEDRPLPCRAGGEACFAGKRQGGEW